MMGCKGPARQTQSALVGGFCRALQASAGVVPTQARAAGSSSPVRRLTFPQKHYFHATIGKLEKEFSLPAKRLVFEDVSAASAGDAGSAEKDEKIKALNAEVADLKGRVLTALADVENMRARMKKSAEEDKKFAVRSFAKGMLEVADCLEKALEAVPEEKRAANADLQSVFEGVELIDKVFIKALSDANITKFHPLNEKFDPEFSSAVFEMPADGKEAGLVGHVIKSGYMIHDRVLRPAEVGVTK